MLYDAQIGTAAEMKELATSKSYANLVEAAFVGSLIRTAAKAGELRVICQHKLGDVLASELESKGYTITHVDISDAPQYIISWENADSAVEENSQDAK